MLNKSTSTPESRILVKDFNKTSIELATQLSKIVPKSIIAKNLSNLKFVISTQKKKLIETFILHVLIHKSKIDEGDENFFLNNNYDDLTAADEENEQRVFEFKDIWGELSNENKQLVIQYMQCLCNLSQKYFLIKQPPQNT